MGLKLCPPMRRWPQDGWLVAPGRRGFASLSPEHRLIMSMSLFGGRAWIGGLGFWIDRLGFGRLGPRQPRALLILDMVKFGSPGLRNVSVNRW